MHANFHICLSIMPIKYFNADLSGNQLMVSQQVTSWRHPVGESLATPCFSLEH